ncbi:MAG: SDR family NAD(P)-dependent oxidoreductase [Planctomycetota bacterium]
MSAAGPAAVAGRQAGRHILVTGAGSGIGRAMALRLAAEGAQLSLLGRRIETLEAVAAEAQGPAPRCFACDVREESSTMDAVARAVAASGPLHAAVANAGIGGPNEPGTGDRFADLVQTNLFGVYHTLRAAQAHLAGPETGRRDLVATASILARIGVPGYSGYCASKAAVTGLVRALAAELAPAGIQVNAIAPGWVETEMAWQGIRGMAEGMGVSEDQAHAIAMQAVPSGRMGKPEEVAGLLAWLLSADAGGVTGQTLDMNGGAFML